MNKTLKTVLTIVAIVAAVLLLIVGLVIGCVAFVAGNYNGMVDARETVDTAYSNIDTQLQRRADLIPNLVDTVASFNKHETDIVTAITDARAAIAAVDNAATTEENLAANEQLTTAITNLNLIVENYPDIKADATYSRLMDELAGTENRIAVARRDYNEAVSAYNKKIAYFPGNIFAGIFGFEKAEYYQASEGAETAPDVGALFG